MSLQTRLEALVAAFGADVKSLKNEPAYLRQTALDGQVRSSTPRTGLTQISAAVSGRMTATRLFYKAGEVVTSIGWFSGTTAGAGLTHCWYALYDPNMNLMGVTVNDTSATWAANTGRLLAMVTPVVIPADGYYFHTYCVVGTTVPTVLGQQTPLTVIAMSPNLSFAANTGRTNPASAPATLTVGASPASHLTSWSQ